MKTRPSPSIPTSLMSSPCTLGLMLYFHVHHRLLGHVAEHREDDEASDETCGRVDGTCYQGVFVAVVVKLVVAGEGEDGPEARAQGKENLCGRGNPHLGGKSEVCLETNAILPRHYWWPVTTRSAGPFVMIGGGGLERGQRVESKVESGG